MSSGRRHADCNLYRLDSGPIIVTVVCTVLIESGENDGQTGRSIAIGGNEVRDKRRQADARGVASIVDFQPWRSTMPAR
jgi:hypothetical protein